MQNKSVQIPYELFFQLLQYFLMDNYDGEEIIRLGLEKKLDAMVNREVYSKSKTAPTEEEREVVFDGQRAKFEIRPFEIKTFLLV